MDKFDELFDLQNALNKRIGVDTDNMSDEEKTKWVLNYTRAMQQEMSELIDSVPWKWWAKYQEFDEQNAKVEVVDLFHFVISLAQVLGMTPEDVHAAYTKRTRSIMIAKRVATSPKTKTTRGTFSREATK